MTVQTTFAGGVNPFDSLQDLDANQATTTRKRIINVLMHTLEPLSIKQIANAACASETSVSKTLHILQDDGRVKSTGFLHKQNLWEWVRHADSALEPAPTPTIDHFMPPNPPKPIEKKRTGKIEVNMNEVYLTDDLPRQNRLINPPDKYRPLFERMKMDGGGIRVATRRQAESVAKSLKRWIQQNGKTGRATSQTWEDGIRVFWVSK